MKIKRIYALEVLDSRGNPTLKSFVELDNGVVGWAFVPSGASTGSHEALELRDGGKRYNGKGVLKAVDNVNTVINRALRGFKIDDLPAIDKALLELDGTENKSNLGANAILSVSLACARALAGYLQRPLWEVLNQVYFSNTQIGFPRPFVNVINGGAHANFRLDFQEFLIIPRTGSILDDIRIASEIFHKLGELLKSQGKSTLVGDEGGFSPELEKNAEAFELILKAAQTLGYENTRDFNLGIDAAATEFFNAEKYFLKKEGKELSSEELLQFYKALIEAYDLYSFEDPFAEDDWESFSLFTKSFQERMIIGDDLYVTNPKRIEKGIKLKATNAVLIKVNQIGTLFETVEAIKTARKAGFKIVISHRSGETEDPFIADLSVACSAEFIKTGSTCRSERTAKYNRLIEIYQLESQL